MKNKSSLFLVIVCCQGQPFYYFYKSLVSALFGLAYLYVKKKKHCTMRFSLKQVFDTDKEYKTWQQSQKHPIWYVKKS